MLEVLSTSTALAKKLARTGACQSGQVITELPSSITSDKLYNFKAGGIWEALLDQKRIHALEGTWESVFTYDSWLVEKILLYLKKDMAVAMFLDALGTRDGKFTQQSKAERVYFGTEVYYLVRSSNRTEERVREALHHADSGPLSVIVLTKLREQQDLKNDGKLTDNDLDLLAANTENIAILAYDGEGYLLWSK